jgi:hypothetical protein
MTDFLTPPALIAFGAVILAAVAVLSAVMLARRAATRAVAAERRLSALYSEIEAAIGDRIDRSAGGGWRDQVSASLKRLATVTSNPSGRGDTTTDWMSTAVRALDTAARAVEALEPESEPARIAAALGLAGRLAESREGVGAVASANDLESALVSGTLNDVLTTAPLVAGYFSRDAGLAPVTEAYLIAAAALRLALAEANIVVETPAVLSIVSGREARGEVLDGRELRRIREAKTLANRIADRLAPGENLIVYCSVPGWTTRDARRPPAVVFWNSASWL